MIMEYHHGHCLGWSSDNLVDGMPTLFINLPPLLVSTPLFVLFSMTQKSWHPTQISCHSATHTSIEALHATNQLLRRSIYHFLRVRIRLSVRTSG